MKNKEILPGDIVTLRALVDQNIHRYDYVIRFRNKYSLWVTDQPFGDEYWDYIKEFELVSSIMRDE